MAIFKHQPAQYRGYITGTNDDNLHIFVLMEMKLTQRVVISYYKAKFRTIGLLSPKKAAESAYRLFCTPYFGKPKRKAPPVFHKAEQLSFDIDDLTIRGFHWKPEKSNGRRVIIVHGFSSYSYKFENYVHLLFKEGFEVFAFDAPGHGISDGKLINALIYKNMLLRVEALYGPFDGFIGHSLGALATSLAMEEMKGNPDKKMVLIAPATETSTAIRQYCRILQIKEATKTALEQLIISIAHRPISYFSVNRAVQQVPTPTLWIHDKNDTICPFKDTLPIRQSHQPSLQFMATEGLGHNRIYHDRQVSKAVIQFLAS